MDKEHQKSFSITLLCKIFKLNRSAYYHWVKSGSVIKKVDKQLNILVKEVFISSREAYGVRPIKESLIQRYGVIISKRRIGRIMNLLNLKTKMKRRFKVTTTNSNHNFTIALNIINRDFYSSNPNDKYVGGITYIKTEQGTMYLATVIDLYSRKVVGWSMNDSMTK